MSTVEEVLFEEIDNPPDPARAMEGLRDTGYQFNTAIADLIDNSIAANASLVDIQIEMEFDGTIAVYIADNGCGMDRETLVDAMKYGSPPREDPASLGKFGLGLKTASTAFCRRLTVASRPAGDAVTLSATWDLDHVSETREWRLQLGKADAEFVDRLNGVAPNRPGTLVVWQKVDRLLEKEYSDPGGTWARRALRKVEDNLRDHIGLVYQRFLDPDDERARTVRILVNGNHVEAWDPFEPVPGSKLVAEEEVPVDMPDGTRATFIVRAFVLP